MTLEDALLLLQAEKKAARKIKDAERYQTKVVEKRKLDDHSGVRACVCVCLCLSVRPRARVYYVL